MISFVCGQLCSGKTLYSKALAHTCNGIYLEVGDIVRSIKLTENRQELQNSSNLYSAIIQKLKEEIEKNKESDLVISGVRQKEILEAFKNSTLLWIECPIAIREERYNNRARIGDNQTFEQAEQGDINLGILKVKTYILEQNNL
jgi:cytidylate kinase